MCFSLLRVVSQMQCSSVWLSESQFLRLSNPGIPYLVIHLPKKELPLITYIDGPQLRAVFLKNDPQSGSAIPTPPCRWLDLEALHENILEAGQHFCYSAVNELLQASRDT